jgi:ribulose-phosphate 3-epimerase
MNNQKMISPSLMCMDFTKFSEQMATFERHGIEYLHLDVMDGSFVPNFTLGTDFIRQVRNCCQIPLDIHLMINDPEHKLEWFAFGEGDIVSVHAESTKHLQLALKKIRDRGAKAFVALNPPTPISTIEDVLDDVDGILVMTVNPGFAGQGFIDFTKKKIDQLVKLKEEYGYKLMIDGHCTPAVVKEMSDMGVDGFILGSSALFRKGRTYEELIRELRGEQA